MTINLYYNTSENIKLDKTLTAISTLTGYLRDGCSIINPVVLIQGTLEDVGQTLGVVSANYAQIPEFERYYFITNIESVRQGLIAISMRVDVLSSFKDGIRANKGIVSRSENAGTFNLYLNDGSLKAYQNPYVLTEPFTAGFSGSAFCLAVAGG